MYHIKDILSKYEWKDRAGWLDVCSHFSLARSFSFFRLREEEHHTNVKSNRIVITDEQLDEALRVSES